MAKGNLIQGLGRGKMGDVVFYRSNGEQISRVRVRHINNPKTNKQQLQRAIMSTVLKAYSAGKEIFDHSFQGKKVGAGNQQQFLSLNAIALRSAMAADFDANNVDAAATAHVVSPKTLYPVINPYIISRGSYQQRFFTYEKVEQDGQELDIIRTPNPNEGETIAQYVERTGLFPGDLYTIVAIGVGEYDPSFVVSGVSTNYGKQFPAEFGWVRLQVKESVATDTTAISATTPLSALFDITASSNMTWNNSTYVGDSGINAAEVYPTGFGGLGVANGIIRSRLDMDLRSNSEMHVFMSDDGAGITSNHALAAWTQGTDDLGASELILEGGNF